MTRGRALLVALLSGVVLSFAFPGPDLAPLAWFSIAPMIAIIRGRKPRPAALIGFVFGIGFFGTLLIWIKYVGWIAWVVLVLYQSAFTAAFGAGWARLATRFRGLGAAAGAAALWVALEYIRSHVPVVGFTWGQLAQSQHALWWMLRPAAFAGGWGISFIVIAVNALVVEVAREWRSKGFRNALMPAIACIALIAAPALIPPPKAAGTPLDMAIVQGNVPRDFVGTITEKNLAILNSHATLTSELAGEGIDVVVWPESAVGLDLTKNNLVGRSVSRAARTAAAEMIVGGNLDVGRHFYKVLAFHFDRAGQLVDQYQKTHLVPFGEYVPARRVLGWIPMLAQVPRDAIAGTEPGVFQTENGPIAPVISFEGDFGSLVRSRLGPDGGHLLVVATNTSTWGDSWASTQHVAFSQLRAVENGVWVAHAALSGISAFIAPDGSVVDASELWTEDTLIRTVRMTEHSTFYGRVGDWLPIFCLVVTVVDLVLARRRRTGSVA